jgi:hypothetical protein
VNYTQCVLPNDQGRGSLEGAWANLPLPVVFDNDFYLTDNGEIVPSLRSALATWNTWAALKNFHEGFRISNDGTGAGYGRIIHAITSSAQAA